MSIFEVSGGPINYQYLMNKTKSDLAYLVLEYCRSLEEKEKAIDRLENQALEYRLQIVGMKQPLDHKDQGAARERKRKD